MAKNFSSKKPLSIKLSSHAKNKTNSKQNPNLQTYKINGVKINALNVVCTVEELIKIEHDFNIY